MGNRTIIRRVFKDSESRLMTIQLGQMLEKIVQKGLEIKGKRRFPSSELDHEIEKKGAQIIRGIVRAMDPDNSGNIGRMNGLIIWRVFWRLQYDSTKTKMGIFELLEEIENNPPFWSLTELTAWLSRPSR